MLNPVNLESAHVQNVPLSPLQPPMQPPWPPTPVMASSKSNNFAPDFSTNPQANEITNQSDVQLRPESSSMPGQLSLPNTLFAQQQNPTQLNLPHATQLPNTHLPHNFSPFLNPHVVISSHHLVDTQVPVIPPSIAPQLHTFVNQQQNSIRSSPARPLLSATALKHPFSRNHDLKLWRFPQNNLTKLNQRTNIAAVFNNFRPTLPPSTAKTAISHAISQTITPQNVSSNHAATFSNQVNAFSTANNINPPFVMPFVPPMYGHTAPAPLCWDGPLHPTSLAPAA